MGADRCAHPRCVRTAHPNARVRTRQPGHCGRDIRSHPDRQANPTLDGVVHVPFPIVRTHIGKRGRDPALRRDGVRAGRKYLGDTGRAQPRL